MKLTSLLFAVALVPAGASWAATSVSQPYRPVNQTAQWTIEGQSHGLLKVRVLINGQVVANGPMKDSDFTSSYDGHPVRVTCSIGRTRFSGPADQTCAVYVDNELAANLYLVHRG